MKKNEASKATPPSDAKKELQPIFDEVTDKVQRLIDAGEGDVTVNVNVNANCPPRRGATVQEKVTFAKAS